MTPTICAVDPPRDRFPFISREQTPIAFCTIDRPETDIPGTQALGREHGIIEVYYRDGWPTQRPDMLGLTGYAGVYAYPTIDIVDLHDSLDILYAVGIPLALNVATYRQFAPGPPHRYSWTEQQVVDRLRECWDLVCEFRIEVIIGFAGVRMYEGEIVDGLARWPAIRKAWEAMRSACGGGLTFPRRVEVTELARFFPRARML